jgi:hypothetical protein
MRSLPLLSLLALLGCSSAPSTTSPGHAVIVAPPGTGEAAEVEEPALPRPARRGNEVAALCSNALAVGVIDPAAPLLGIVTAKGGNLMSPQFDGGTGFFAVKGAAPAPRAAADTPLEIRLEGPTQVAKGDAMHLRVAFVNRSDGELTVLRPLDGSFERMRYPAYDLYARDDASGDVYRYAFVGGRCGNVNPIGNDDYAAIAPGAVRDDIVSNGWAGHIDGGAIAKPGRYSVWLAYSFCGFEHEDGLPLGPNQKRALHTGVHVSNAVSIDVN